MGRIDADDGGHTDSADSADSNGTQIKLMGRIDADDGGHTDPADSADSNGTLLAWNSTDSNGTRIILIYHRFTRKWFGFWQQWLFQQSEPWKGDTP